MASDHAMIHRAFQVSKERDVGRPRVSSTKQAAEKWRCNWLCRRLKPTQYKKVGLDVGLKASATKKPAAASWQRRDDLAVLRLGEGFHGQGGDVALRAHR